MKVQFLGAARTVTGSCFIMETGKSRFAVECGMYQGIRDVEKRNWDSELYDPENLDFILVTHAHIDHSGLLPRLVKMGFSGPIYTTTPTKDLLEILLLDSAYIQEMEARWESEKRMKKGKKPVEALYTKEDAEKTLPLLQDNVYNEMFEPAEDVRVNFKDAGHILGSSFVELWVDEGNEQRTKIVFSGDLGRPDQLFLRDPSIVESADFLFLESTYGNRNHKNLGQSRDELADAIAYSHPKGEKVIIPAFAVERTQEIIYSLFILSKEGRLPRDMPVFVDSPLAIRATEIFRKHPEFFDKTTREYLKEGENPLDLPNLKFTLSADESKTLNTMEGPAVIISASGMANAGRIKHHLTHNIWREGASIVFVGFQAQGTLGRKIVDGASKIRIFGEDVAVKAKVYTIGGFSAHAGQSQILEWLGNFRSQHMEVFLVHGEYSAQKVLAKLIREKFGYTVRIPDFMHECILKPQKALEQPRDIQRLERVTPSIDWQYLIQETDTKMTELKDRLEQVDTIPWGRQSELRERLMELNNSMTTLITDICSDVECGNNNPS